MNIKNANHENHNHHNLIPDMLFGECDCIRKLSEEEVNNLVTHFKNMILPLDLLKDIIVFEIHSFYDINLLLGQVDAGQINMTIKFDHQEIYNKKF